MSLLFFHLSGSRFWKKINRRYVIWLTFERCCLRMLYLNVLNWSIRWNAKLDAKNKLLLLFNEIAFHFVLINNNIVLYIIKTGNSWRFDVDFWSWCMHAMSNWRWRCRWTQTSIRSNSQSELSIFFTWKACDIKLFFFFFCYVF